MVSILRLLLTGLLVLALPVQGLASVARWHCAGMSHHGLTLAAHGPSTVVHEQGSLYPSYPDALARVQGHAHDHNPGAGHDMAVAQAHPGCPHAMPVAGMAGDGSDDLAVADDVPHELTLIAHADAEVEVDDQPTSQAHSCSACAMCCIGLALPAAVAALPMVATHTEAVSVTHPMQVSFIADGVERPPRNVLV